MPISEVFAEASASPIQACAKDQRRRKRLAPFSVRLTETERDRLMDEAKGLPLGTYIKAKALGGSFPPRRGSGFSVRDRQSLAKALALLGGSRIANNLNQLAHAANIGTLPLTPETEADLLEALHHVREVRDLLIAALGLKPGGRP
ncbi:MAG: plasmid mobilization relaxosome protein MobC [Alphaproteobacteria bacterium]|nr:plasmid mobilization relaxosome protein MobC [Alphaproteobacteria bacterium]